MGMKVGDAMREAIRMAIDKQDYEPLSKIVFGITNTFGSDDKLLFDIAHQNSGISEAEWKELLKKINP